MRESFGPTLTEWMTDETSGSAVLEAKRFLAKNAVLVVHSFSAQQDGFSDFRAFARQFGASVSNPGELAPAGTVSDVELFLGWAQGPVPVTPPTVG